MISPETFQRKEGCLSALDQYPKKLHQHPIPCTVFKRFSQMNEIFFNFLLLHSQKVHEQR